jgi:hypothetical protein
MNTNLPNNNSNSRNPRSDPTLKSVSSMPSPISGGHKEAEFVTKTTKETISESPVEIELPREVEAIGAQKISETIELPPDVKQLGGTSPVPPPITNNTKTVSNVVLPIPDQMVIKGLHENVTSAFKWLSVWCIKKLQKAHLALKVVHGKIIRVRV